MPNRRGLGKGLEALIPEGVKAVSREMVEIAVEEILPNKYQPRQTFSPEEMRSLVNSIREKGVIQPVLVRRRGDKYEMVAGERRWRAAKEAGLEKLPVIIKDVSDRELFELALTENIQREDLNPLEKAQGYSRFLEEFGITQEELARRLGVDRSTITNTLRLLNLPPEVQKEIREGRITMGHARALLSLPTEAARVQLCQRIIREGLSVREVERLAQGKRGKPRGPGRKPGMRKPEVRALEERLEHKLGTRVRIREKGKGGILTIEYYSEEDLGRILDILGISD